MLSPSGFSGERRTVLQIGEFSPQMTLASSRGSVPFESSALHSIDSFFGDRDKDTQKTGTWCENCPMLSVYGSVAL